ncbi:dihydroxyacetone kinase subunit DhaK [Salmonella enterica]|uniref:Dihydroxyacetone kinase subunit DhaK n=1 Tax=Salmonella enterica subsp. VII serovar 40:z4,z24:[z39] TaxID=1967625 RepID=A0A731XUP4_SALEE|nr:dihydroxyacetone kinase subunit DhaK [Salmonella enterica]EDO5298259.1 dihydroxyacetone kinase subunit DhaK [Salmonella enterica subsp. houtenae serovar 40:z4,z24:-]QUZ23516.1 dihydroxyacetone kinase subunit DhaK [Salmonella enterica subsp. VII str. CFSAN000554]HAE4733562.1 dihydroxyacetone kinase subunit DhaK [Salmonella enterica subsp. VII serovar 40:z4,z24:[z39]]HCA3677913.1 dihydroxyacetone kinase subunit DhaK [Salmonella enterica subsp. houtenae serovar Houten]
MQKPKKLFNNTDNIRSEIMQGLVYTGMGKIHALTEYCAVYRTIKSDAQTVIVSGGGSGHEPTFAGFVGEGGIDACALGELFTSPSPDQIIEASRAVHQGSGVLFLYGNYSGDGMNFDIAAEILAEEGIECRTVRATDDIASAPPERMSDRRGVGGLAFLYKLAGAAAQFEHYTLPALEALAQKANRNTRTIGVALNGCALPQSDTFNFTLADNEIELGIGIHGEPGLCRMAMPHTDELVGMMISRLCDDLPLDRGDRVCVCVNNLGALSNTELMVITRKVGMAMDERGIHTHDVQVGHFCTSLEMSGFSLSLLRLDEEMQHLYDHPIHTLGWRK